MRLAEFAVQEGVSKKTAYRWHKSGKLNSRKVGNGTIIVDSAQPYKPESEQADFVIPALSELEPDSPHPSSSEWEQALDDMKWKTETTQRHVDRMLEQVADLKKSEDYIVWALVFLMVIFAIILLWLAFLTWKLPWR